MDYEKMLKKAYESLPSVSSETSRFNIPLIQSIQQGNKTVLTNFSQICNTINRKKEQVFKFFLRGLATAGELKDHSAIFIGRFGRKRLQDLFDKFLKEYVYCNECKKPETKLIREDRITFMKCGVCGAKQSVKSLK
ncbi:MAG: translation initiation factor IF-2 subunit beta [Nanoarchaeota archaeon]|nr:translation initiation factor IF-2 subunit beta [Nanoarchaeota archaeon]